VALAAAIATIWLLIHQIGEARKARKDAHHERSAAAEDRELARAEYRDREAAQARAVVLAEHSMGIQVPRTDGLFHVSVTIWNYSPEPILDLTVVLMNREHEYWRLWTSPLLAPGACEEIDVALKPTPGVQLWLSDTLPELYFTDAGGRRWSRFYGGSPSRDLFPLTPTWDFTPVRDLEGKSEAVDEIGTESAE
jgi:hypothetical protein